jgi:prophage regulatory protein
MIGGTSQVTSRASLDLMGAAEIGRLLGVSRQRVQQLIRRPDFPAPAGVLEMGKVWLRADIQAWVAQYRPTERPR